MISVIFSNDEKCMEAVLENIKQDLWPKIAAGLSWAEAHSTQLLVAPASPACRWSLAMPWKSDAAASVQLGAAWGSFKHKIRHFARKNGHCILSHPAKECYSNTLETSWNCLFTTAHFRALPFELQEGGVKLHISVISSYIIRNTRQAAFDPAFSLNMNTCNSYSYTTWWLNWGTSAAVHPEVPRGRPSAGEGPQCLAFKKNSGKQWVPSSLAMLLFQQVSQPARISSFWGSWDFVRISWICSCTGFIHDLWTNSTKFSNTALMLSIYIYILI